MVRDYVKHKACESSVPLSKLNRQDPSCRLRCKLQTAQYSPKHEVHPRVTVDYSHGVWARLRFDRLGFGQSRGRCDQRARRNHASLGRLKTGLS